MPRSVFLNLRALLEILKGTSVRDQNIERGRKRAVYEVISDGCAVFSVKGSELAV